MATDAQPLTERVPCSVCGKELDPNKPLGGRPSDEELSHPTGGLYCMECWCRETGASTVKALLARVQDRVFLA